MKLDAKSTIEAGKAILGIELGSTRIKAVLIDQENKPIAQGSHTWENQLVDGLWTYSIEAIWSGLQDCYADLRANVKNCIRHRDRDAGCYRCQRYDAWLYAVQQKRRNPRAFPHLEKHQYRPRSSCFIRTVCLQYPAAMEHFSLVSGYPGQRSARE